MTDNNGKRAIDGLVQFVLGTKYQDIPPEVITSAKTPFLDTIGVALLGSTYPCARITIDLVKDMGGNPQATVIGSGFKTSTGNAAFANGVSAFSPDFDDFNVEDLLHQSAVLIPTILAAGEKMNASGKDIMAAYVVGWEVMDAIGHAAEAGRFAHRHRGWHPTCSIGTLGATAVAAKVLGLDIARTKMALGIAGSMASGTVQQYGTMAFSLHAGISARNGVTAAMLAQKGVSAEEDILESQYGFFNLYNGECNYDPLNVDNLGNPYTLVSPGFGLKKYSCCGLMQCSIEAMQELVIKERFEAEDVEKIEIGIHPTLKGQIAMYSDPQTPEEAQFSEQFHAAVGVVYPDVVGYKPYEQDILQDKRVRRLMKNIEVYVHPDLTEESPTAFYTHYLRVKLIDGREFAFQKAVVGGNIKKPLSEQEVLEKYRGCAKKALSPPAIDTTIDMINNLEKLKNIGALTRELNPASN